MTHEGPLDKTARSAAAPQQGSFLLHYELLGLLGEGGMGAVYRARDLKLGRMVAIKRVLGGERSDPSLEGRLVQEARAAAALSHPNIVTVHAIEESSEGVFMVMELLEGEPLDARLARGPLGLRELVAVGVEVADALGCAHAKGLVHRDIKPANVLLTTRGAKVLDFGICKGAPGPSSNVPLTQAGAVIGTWPYMSPEQIRGEPLDGRSDLFSLGVVLYEAATGRRPFPAENLAALAHQITQVEPAPPSTLKPELPRALDEVVWRALAKEPSRRFANAGELVDALRGLQPVTTGATPDARVESPKAVSVAVLALQLPPSASGAAQDHAPPAVLQVIASRGGRVLDSPTGSVVASFTRPTEALFCAIDLRDAAAPGRPAARIGVALHAAEGQPAPDDLALARAIVPVIAPGEIWVSAPFFRLVQRDSPFSFGELGARALGSSGASVQLLRVEGEAPGYRFKNIHVEEAPRCRPVRECSIAVMPLRVGGNDEERHYLAEGLTEDIIVELSRFKKLRVIARSASMVYDGRSIDPARIGQDLGVQYALEGQLMGSRETTRISLKLISTQTGATIWADRVVRPTAELFDAIEEIVQKVAATIVGRVEAAEIEAVRRKPPSNLTAYDCVLRGLELHRMGGTLVDNQRQAVAWFDKAIAADPEYGVAYAWRVCAAANLPDFSLSENLPLVHKALELDESNAEAHRIMSSVHLENGNLDLAEHHLSRAMQLSPSDAYIKSLGAKLFTFRGEVERALALIDEAQALDPYLPAWCVVERAIALYAAGRYAESEKTFQTAPFATRRAGLYHAAALVALGNLDEARRVVAKAIGNEPQFTAGEFVAREQYRDPEVRKLLRERLVAAGLPA